MSRSHRIAVLIPTHNGARFIGECLESVLAQTHDDLRVVISDDASTDGTIDVCRSATRTDARVEIHRSTENLGWVGNINTLLDRVTEDRFVIVPHDDIIAPTYLERMASALAADDGTVCAYSDIQGFGNRSLLIGFEPWPGDRTERVHAFVSEWPVAVAYRGLTRRVVLDSGIRVRQGTRNSFHADTLYVMEMLGVGGLRRVPESLYRKRFLETSVIAEWDSREDRPGAWADHTMATVEVIYTMSLSRRARRRIITGALDRLVRVLGFGGHAGREGFQALKRAVGEVTRLDRRWRNHGWASARVDFANALRHHARGRLGPAQRLAETAIARDPMYAEARGLLARIQSARGDHVAAIEEVGRAVAAQPWNQWVRLEASRALAAAGLLREALREAERATSLGVLSPESFLEAGKILEQLGDRRRAFLVLQRALAVDPANHEAAIRLREAEARCITQAR